MYTMIPTIITPIW